jgi:hypothetical protein
MQGNDAVKSYIRECKELELHVTVAQPGIELRPL